MLALSPSVCYSAWAAKREEQQKALRKRAQLRHEKKSKLEAYAGHGFKYGGSSSQINMMQRKAGEAAKLDEEAAAEVARRRLHIAHTVARAALAP